MVMPAAAQTGGDGYGVLVYQTVDEVMSRPLFREHITPPTIASIGSYLVSAYEVASAAHSFSGSAIESIVDLAVDVALDLAGEIVTSIVNAISSVIDMLPVIEALFGVIMDIGAIFSAGFEEEKKAMAIEQANLFQECINRRKWFEPRPSHGGQFMPADFFVMVEKVGIDTHRVMPEKTPYIGRFLQLITESMWGQSWFDEQKAFNMMGIGPQSWKLLTAGTQSASFAMCEMPQFPPILDFASAFSMLRQAIVAQSIANRQLKGLSKGDGGESIWPIYLDLLRAAIYKPRWPLGQEMPGDKQVAPLNPTLLQYLYASNGALLRLYTDFNWLSGGKDWYGNQAVGAACVGQNQKYHRQQYASNLIMMTEYNTTKRVLLSPTTPGGAERLQRSTVLSPEGTNCMGSSRAAYDSVIGMTNNWDDTINPAYAPKEQELANTLEKAWLETSDEVKARLEELDLVTSVSGAKPANKAATAIATIGNLRRAGVLTEESAIAGAEGVNQGKPPSMWPILAAAGALGFLALRKK